MTTLNRSISEIYEITHLMFAHTKKPLVELEREDEEKLGSNFRTRKQNLFLP